VGEVAVIVVTVVLVVVVNNSACLDPNDCVSTRAYVLFYKLKKEKTNGN